MSHQNDKMVMAISDAMKNLDAAKQEMCFVQASQESLAPEMRSLESTVLDLKKEKEALEVAIKTMRVELENLGEQLGPSRNGVEQLHGDDYDMAFDSQETVFDAPGCVVIDDRSMVSTNAPKNNNGVDGSISVSTATTSSTTFTASSKRRAKKVYNSPKKWRRMIRTHRLRSIFIQNN